MGGLRASEWVISLVFSLHVDFSRHFTRLRYTPKRVILCCFLLLSVVDIGWLFYRITHDFGLFLCPGQFKSCFPHHGTLEKSRVPIFVCAEIPKPYPNDTQSSHVFNEGLHPVCRFAAHGVRHMTVAIQRERRGIVAHVFLQGLDVVPCPKTVHCEGMPLRYNYDKPEKPRISRVFGYLARFFILFQTEKSSREVVIL